MVKSLSNIVLLSITQWVKSTSVKNVIVTDLLLNILLPVTT